MHIIGQVMCIQAAFLPAKYRTGLTPYRREIFFPETIIFPSTRTLSAAGVELF